MLTLALALTTATVALGLALAALHLQERPLRARARVLAYAHALLGTLATAAAALLLQRHARDPQNFAHLATWSLAFTLAAGAAVLAARIRQREPAGPLVALHATIGIAAAIMLLAYANIPN